ncbi:MAG: trypsin-like peptidase domain-containing protein, partial [Clostridia bacterium]|nr:trypsin-like peptidase domain-containing protein [Clostridia bacterium]
MKKFIKCLMVVLIIPIAFMFTGCTGGKEAVSIKDIKKTDSIGIVDVYTITYTNGTTDEFTIVNGEDGANLYNNITINDLYNQVKTSKHSGYTLLDFIDEYLDIRLDSSAVASSKALRSAVSIFVEHEITIPDYGNIISYTQTAFGLQPNYGIKNSILWGAGSGVIYNLDKETGDAYILTNYHVCFNNSVMAEDGIATKFTTYIYGYESIDMADLYYLPYYNQSCEEYKSLFKYDANGLPIIDYGFGAINAEYVGGSEQYDIAVLKVTNSEILKNSDCLAVDVYNSDMVTAGSKAIAVGNPDACGISVTEGVISVDSEYISVQIDDDSVVIREFRIDTPVNGGNSGGGLFDGFGRLIGIVNAKTPNTAIENIGYAIPSNVATRVAESIIDNCDGTNRHTSRVLIGV